MSGWTLVPPAMPVGQPILDVPGGNPILDLNGQPILDLTTGWKVVTPGTATWSRVAPSTPP